MKKAEIRKAIKRIFPKAEIRFIYNLAEVINWRELDGGKYATRYSGKADFYEVLRKNNLIDYVTIGA